MLWYVAFTKEPGIHRVMDDQDFVSPNPNKGIGGTNTLTRLKSGTGLPADAGQWSLERIEAEELKTSQKLEELSNWRKEHRLFLNYQHENLKRTNEQEDSISVAVEELEARLKRKMRRLKELKNALVQKRQ